MNTFNLRGIIVDSLLEWNGYIALTAIVGGCNWRCPFCYSKRYVTDWERLDALDTEDIFHLIKKNRQWINGIVITGGEPTLQNELPTFLRRIKKMHLPAKLHSNGSHPEVLRLLLEENLLTCLALDIKSPLDERLSNACGRNLSAEEIAAVQESFSLTRTANVKEKEYHTTLCPSYINENNLRDMAAELAENGLWILQEYEPNDVLDASHAGKKHTPAHQIATLATAARTAYSKGRVELHAAERKNE